MLLLFFGCNDIPAGKVEAGEVLPVICDVLETESEEVAIDRDCTSPLYDIQDPWSVVVEWQWSGLPDAPTFDQVNRAALAYKANAANEARRLSAAQQSALDKAHAANPNRQPKPAPEQAKDWSPKADARLKTDGSHIKSTPSIPAWEIQSDDSSVDAGAECKRITQALNDAHKSVGLLRGILYSQINKYGRDYMGVLRQVDAGVYSLSNIDDQVQQLGEDVEFISALLKADVGEGELARSTIDVDSMPSRA